MAESVKILVIDDRIEMRNILSRLLNTQRFRVITAEEEESGLETAKAERPDLIITDLGMPRLDGIQRTAKLHEQLAFRKVPILVITGNSAGKTAEALRVGANLVAYKPVDLDFFIGQVNQLLHAGAVDPSKTQPYT